MRKTSAGADALIGVAIEIGSVRRARNVNTQEVPTIAHLTAESATTSRVTSAAAPSRPESAMAATYAAQPKHVDMSSVGSTALSRTLAFLARS